MAVAEIQITQGIVVGGAGESVIGFDPTTAITLTDNAGAGATSYLWEVVSFPGPDASAPSITNSTSQVATITPGGGGLTDGVYLLRLTRDDPTDGVTNQVRFFAVGDEDGIALPSAGMHRNNANVGGSALAQFAGWFGSLVGGSNVFLDAFLRLRRKREGRFTGKSRTVSHASGSPVTDVLVYPTSRSTQRLNATGVGVYTIDLSLAGVEDGGTFWLHVSHTTGAGNVVVRNGVAGSTITTLTAPGSGTDEVGLRFYYNGTAWLMWPMVTGGTSSGSLVAANLAALAAVVHTSLPDGTSAEVASLSAEFTLRKTGTYTPDGITIIAASGSGHWVRTIAPSVRWQNQATWYVAWTTGNDENSGLVGNPVKTVYEIFRRTDGLFLEESPYTQISILEDSPENINWYFKSFKSFPPYVIGTPTTIFTGTVSSVQAWARGTAVGEFTCAELPTSWTASSLVGKRFIMTSGALTGYVGWISRDLGTKRCVFSPLCPTLTAWAGVEVGSPGDGDTFDVYDVPELTGHHCFDRSGSYTALLSDLDVGTSGQPHCIDSLGPIQFYQCLLYGLDSESGGISANGCRIDNFRCYKGSASYYGGCLFTNGWTIYDGKLTTSSCVSTTTLYVGRSYGGGNVVLQLDSVEAAPEYGLCVTGPTTAVVMDSGATLDTNNSRIWMRDVATVGFQMSSCTRLIYDDAEPITMLGTVPTTPVSLGGLSVVLADLPAVNMDTDSKVVAK